MVRPSRSHLKRLLNALGDRFVKRVWKDERGMWSLPLCIFILIVSVPFIYWTLDVGDARYTRNVVYTAVDAASLSGAQHYVQQVTQTGSYGQPTAWIYVIDPPNAGPHAEETLLANMADLESKGVILDSYTISYPDSTHIRVDATIHYVAPNITKALDLFLHNSQTITVKTSVHSISTVVQP